MASVVRSAVPVWCDVAVRWTVGFSRVLGSCGLSRVSLGAAAFRLIRAAGPGVRRRPDMALRDLRVRDSGCGRHRAASLGSHRGSATAVAGQSPGAVSMAVSTRLADYWSLTKPEVNLLIGLTTAAGFCLGRPHGLDGFPFARLVHAGARTPLVAHGTRTLNQGGEPRFDA